MKKIFLLFSLVVGIFGASQVLISTEDVPTNLVPDQSAALEVRSNSTGFLPPRLNNAPANPVEGLIYYDLSGHCFKGWNGIKWEVLGGACLMNSNTVVQFSEATASVDENGVYTITIDITNPSAEEISVEGTTSLNNGLTIDDYTTTITSPFIIPSGDSTVTFTFNALGDTIEDLNESFTFTLLNATSATALHQIGANNSIEITINNVTPVPNQPPFVDGAVTITTPLNAGATVSPVYVWADPDNPGAAQTESGTTYSWNLKDDLALPFFGTIGTDQSQLIPTNAANKYVQVCVTPGDGEDMGTQVCSAWTLINQPPPACKTDLVISEYYENGINKYLEVYNGTGADVNLADYEIALYSNGATSSSVTSALQGVLSDGQAIVYSDSGSNEYTGATTNLSAIDFSGNDVVAIRKSVDSSIVDIIGTIGSSANFAADRTVKRKSDVGPSVVYDSSEWTFEANTVSDLGSYTCVLPPPLPDITVSFDPTTATFSEETEAGSVVVNYDNQTGGDVVVNVSSSSLPLGLTLDNQITIPNGTGTYTYEFLWTDNNTEDGDASFTLSFDASPNYVIGTNSSSNVTITDNDTNYTLSIASDGAVIEGTNQTFTVTLSPALVTGDQVTVDYYVIENAPVSAANSSDFTEGVGSLIFSTVGDQVKTITVATLDDSDIESAETYVVTIQDEAINGAGSLSISTGTATGIINDNDAVTAVGYTQDFDTENSWTYTLSTPECSTGGDVWGVVSSTWNQITMNSNFFGITDLNGNCGSSAGETITFSSVNITTETEISFDYNIRGFDSGDDVFYTVILDGNRQTEVQLIDGSSNLTVSGTEVIGIPNGTSIVGFELKVKQNGGDYAGFDNFKIQ